MILDFPNSFNLTLGNKTRIPEERDSQVRIPSDLIPVVLSLRPHTGGLNSAVAQEESGLYGTSQTRTNQAAIQTTFITLAAGLWEIEMSMATNFTFLAAVGSFVGCGLNLTYQNTIQKMLFRLASIGGFVDYNRQRFLLNGQATIQFDLGLTGVGQSLDYVAIVNCIRIL